VSPRTAIAAIAVAATVLTACAVIDEDAASSEPPIVRVTTPPAPADTPPEAPPVPAPPPFPATPPVTEPPAPPVTEPPPPPEPDPVLRPGRKGPEVAALQQRLIDLGYWLGDPDGSYGHATTQAVMAFQKANGLGRDGLAGPATLAAVETAGRPVPRSTQGSLVEIDLSRQLILLVTDGHVDWAFNTSTGKKGWATPPGDFTVFREVDGIRRAPLGDLYRPKYFNGGIAVHGAPSIPGYPASHGCTRVSNAAMDFLWTTGALDRGMPVSVYY
jgi:peptidoglycan hydrolase-like protein with peptidoglycan-binding domain